MMPPCFCLCGGKLYRTTIVTSTSIALNLIASSSGYKKNSSLGGNLTGVYKPDLTVSASAYQTDLMELSVNVLVNEMSSY